MPEHLMIWTVGPVQGFIATARKGSDLWFGSWLLSELSREAARAAQGAGATLLLPLPEAVRDPQAGIPSRLLLWVSDPQGTAKKMQEAVQTRVEGLWDAVFEQVSAQHGAKHLRKDAALAQLLDLPEIQWVSVPMAAAEGFGAALKRAEPLLHGRKAHRPFVAPTWGGGVPKSSLDGARESVVGDAPERVPARELWGRLRLRPREHLCGPGLLKRWGPKVLSGLQTFDGAGTLSTSHIACWAVRHSWESAPDAVKAELKGAFDDYRTTLEGLGGAGTLADELTPQGTADDPVMGQADGSLLYAGRLAEVLGLDPKPGSADIETLERARAALAGLFKRWRAIAKQAGLPPTPHPGAYYAVLVADGDRMGVTFQRLDAHRAQRLSQAVLDFAPRARDLVREHGGVLVYIGGDDVLALLPVQTALPCADALRRLFAESVGATARGLVVGAAGEAAAQELYGEAHTPTLSAGVCIAHHLEPFQEVLRVARDAESAAKQEHGRNAWAVTLRKRGGPPTRCGGSWQDYKRFEQLQAWLAPASGRLPRGLPRDLLDAVARLPLLGEAEEAARPGLAALRVLEVKRVLQQKRLDDEVVQALVDRLGGVPPARLVEELLVARALACNEEDAA